MAPVLTFNHKTRRCNIMSLKTKETNQADYDLEFEAEYVDETELETPKYLTITGKEQAFEPEWERYTVNELDPGVTMEGIPEVTIFKNEDKSYNALRLRVSDDGEMLDCYINFPKKDWPYVKNINNEFEFYRPCFQFIFQILRIRDERNVVDANGEEINRFKTVNLENFAKYLDTMNRVGVKITKRDNSEYNDWEIYKME